MSTSFHNAEAGHRNQSDEKEVRKSMKKLVLVTAILLVLISAIPNLAMAATKQPFYATIYTQEGPGVCDRLWMDEEEILHGRGCVGNGVIAGDINGEITFTQNLNLVAFDENGPIDGDVQLKGEITVEGESEVSYRISVDAIVEDREISGSFVIHGVGSFKGIHIMGTIIGIPGEPVEMIGTILTTKP